MMFLDKVRDWFAAAFSDDVSLPPDLQAEFNERLIAMVAKHDRQLIRLIVQHQHENGDLRMMVGDEVEQLIEDLIDRFGIEQQK